MERALSSEFWKYALNTYIVAVAVMLRNFLKSSFAAASISKHKSPLTIFEELYFLWKKKYDFNLTGKYPNF